MITLKLEYESQTSFPDILKEGNKVVRIAFNLFKKEKVDSVIQCEKYIAGHYTISPILDSSLIRMFCQDAQALYKSADEKNQKTLIFGSRKNWKNFTKGNISKEEFNHIRNNRPIFFMGSKCDVCGNRKVKLDCASRSVVFKPCRNQHHILNIKANDKQWQILEQVEEAASKHLIPVTYRLSDTHVYIIFDEKVLNKIEHKFIKDRVAGLDLNPNYIGFVVRDGEQNIVHKEVIDLTKLNKTHNKNKKDHEVIQVSKRLANLCKHYRVETVGYEDLNTKPKDHGKGKVFNRLVNNSWNRNIFINNFKKRLNILGIKNQNIVAAYSSTIGCINYPDETDSVAAALEIARRVFYFKKKYLDKDKNFLDADIIYPQFDYGKIAERWNSTLSTYTPARKGWKSLHKHLKKKKKLNQLRFLFKDYDFSSWSCLRLKSRKSNISINFI